MRDARQQVLVQLFVLVPVQALHRSFRVHAVLERSVLVGLANVKHIDQAVHGARSQSIWLLGMETHLANVLAVAFPIGAQRRLFADVKEQ